MVSGTRTGGKQMADKPGPVLVTGANSGIGLATMLLLARRGWETWGTVRSKAKAKTLTDAAKEAKVADRVEPVILDVSDDKAVVRRWPELPDFYAVVNNAGYSELGAVEEVTADQARKQLDVNLIAPAVVSSCALPAMRERRAGRIVMVSSMFGRAAIMPLNAWYHASKFGLEALSDVLRMEVAGFGVKVAIVEPGFFKTGITSDTKARVGARLGDESPYRTAYERTASSVETMERLAPPPDAVAQVIASAVESARPLRRYVVGVDALALVATHPLIPRAFTDAATRLLTGLGGSPSTFT
jgi:NAD(P)-dependent dehydrogenase (short-subunit alcohol dehydrogenase family)